MEIGSDGSGKLITQLRKTARKFAEQADVTIIDGSPGIGCPVISSVTGTDIVLIVTEPTMSGLGDFERVSELCIYFGIPAFACINKYDINEEIGKQIESYCIRNGIKLVGKIPYDEKVAESINSLKPITEYEHSKANKAVRSMFNELKVCTDRIISNQ
jgi:MinD superfamily P-loop ATPase